MGITYSKNDVVLCRVLSNDVDAHIAKSLLDEADIASVLDNETFSRIYPIGFNSIGGIRLMVFESDLEKADALLRGSGL